MSEQTDKITKEIREVCGEGSFRPFAVYSESLNCIFALTEDCSVEYQKADEILTLLEDMYADNPEEKYVGFIIENARTFCSKHGLIATNGAIKLAGILDSLAAVFPGSLEKQNIARKILSDSDLNVVKLTDDNS